MSQSLGSDGQPVGGIRDMFDHKLASSVVSQFSKIKDYMSDKGNYICNSCGTPMQTSSSCIICPKCGSKDCGGE